MDFIYELNFFWQSFYILPGKLFHIGKHGMGSTKSFPPLPLPDMLLVYFDGMRLNKIFHDVRLHSIGALVTSSAPCWSPLRTDFSLPSFVSTTNMAAMSLPFQALFRIESISLMQRSGWFKSGTIDLSPILCQGEKTSWSWRWLLPLYHSLKLTTSLRNKQCVKCRRHKF